MEWFIFWLIVNCIVGYLIGKERNDVAGAITISILLGPIGWIVALLSKGNLRKCPFCAEHVKPEAKVCHHCGKDLPELPAPAPPAAAPKTEAPQVPPLSSAAIITVSAIVVIVLAAVVVGVKQNQKSQKLRDELNHALSESRLEGGPAPAPPTSAAETPQESYHWSLTLNKPTELKDSVGRVVARLEKGQSVQYTFRDNYIARIVYGGTYYEIPLSSTDLK